MYVCTNTECPFPIRATCLGFFSYPFVSGLEFTPPPPSAFGQVSADDDVMSKVKLPSRTLLVIDRYRQSLTVSFSLAFAPLAVAPDAT